jgi:phosphatidylglycerol:prolipoprotein diacylglycerol transferase
MAIPFPDINPVILPIGPLAISWYSLSYVVSIIIGSFYCKFLISKYNIKITKAKFDDFISFLIIGIIVGGRLGYVLIYDPIKYLSDPIQILKTYEGGMSFHGGLIGVILATVFFCKRYKIDFFEITDLLAAATPIGLFLGRIANFINGELVGRVAPDYPLSVLFPPDFLPRHPSQIYEALTEGLLTFIIINFAIYKYNLLRKKTVISGLFLLMYGICRIGCEFFRAPDPQVGFIFDYFTMGQILSTPFIICGVCLLCLSFKKSTI